jgi:TonB family protein
VEAGSPAAKAGFKLGHIVLDYNGQAVEGKTQLSRLVNETPAGRQVKIGVWRAGARLTLTPTVEASEYRPPDLIRNVQPELTPQAKKAGIEGTVSVYAEIGTDGRVYRARVVEGLGYGLDDKAMEAVAQWRFNPGRKNGIPVITSATVQVQFRRQQ